MLSLSSSSRGRLYTIDIRFSSHRLFVPVMVFDNSRDNSRDNDTYSGERSNTHSRIYTGEICGIYLILEDDPVDGLLALLRADLKCVYMHNFIIQGSYSLQQPPIYNTFSASSISLSTLNPASPVVNCLSSSPLPLPSSLCT